MHGHGKNILLYQEERSSLLLNQQKYICGRGTEELYFIGNILFKDVQQLFVLDLQQHVIGHACPAACSIYIDIIYIYKGIQIHCCCVKTQTRKG